MAMTKAMAVIVAMDIGWDYDQDSFVKSDIPWFEPGSSIRPDSCVTCIHHRSQEIASPQCSANSTMSLQCQAQWYAKTNITAILS